MFPHTDDENLDEKNDSDLLIDEDAEKEIAVPFEDDEESDEEDNF